MRSELVSRVWPGPGVRPGLFSPKVSYLMSPISSFFHSPRGFNCCGRVIGSSMNQARSVSRNRRTSGDGLRNGDSKLSAAANPCGNGDAVPSPFPQPDEQPSTVYHMPNTVASASWPILSLTRWPILRGWRACGDRFALRPGSSRSWPGQGEPAEAPAPTARSPTAPGRVHWPRGQGSFPERAGSSLKRPPARFRRGWCPLRKGVPEYDVHGVGPKERPGHRAPTRLPLQVVCWRQQMGRQSYPA